MPVMILKEVVQSDGEIKSEAKQKRKNKCDKTKAKIIIVTEMKRF